MTASSRPPVILQVLPALHSGGVERGTIEMVEAVSKAGGTALVAGAEGRLVPLVRYYGGRHIPLNAGEKSPAAILRNAARLRSVIAREGVSLVHARSRAPAWVARLAVRSRSEPVPLVTTWHGVHKETFPGKKLWNSVLASGDRVIAISRFIAERLEQDYAVGPDRLRVIPRGADTQQFDPAAIRGNRVQALIDSWNIAEDVPVILMPGRLTEWKGQGVLLEALGRILRNGMAGPDWVCVFIGDSGHSTRYPEQLRAQVEQLGLGDHVRFAGHCSDMPAALALSELVVAASLKPEPFGRVVVEAQAMERPVIVAEHGGAMETVTHGDTGILVPPGDAGALAVMIAATLNASPEQRAQMGLAARENVLAHYTTRAMQHATLAVYDELLGTGMAPALAEVFAAADALPPA